MTAQLPTWPSQHLQQEEQFLILACSKSKIACPANSWKASRIMIKNDLANQRISNSVHCRSNNIQIIVPVTYDSAHCTPVR